MLPVLTAVGGESACCALPNLSAATTLKSNVPSLFTAIWPTRGTWKCHRFAVVESAAGGARGLSTRVPGFVLSTTFSDAGSAPDPLSLMSACTSMSAGVDCLNHLRPLMSAAASPPGSGPFGLTFDTTGPTSSMSNCPCGWTGGAEVCPALSVALVMKSSGFSVPAVWTAPGTVNWYVPAGLPGTPANDWPATSSVADATSPPPVEPIVAVTVTGCPRNDHVFGAFTFVTVMQSRHVPCGSVHTGGSCCSSQTAPFLQLFDVAVHVPSGETEQPKSRP